MNLKIKIEQKALKQKFDQIQKALQQDILDQKLNASLYKLKKELLGRLESLKLQPKKTKVKSINGLGQDEVSVSRVESDVLKFLTKGRTDIKNYNSSKSFTELSETNLLIGHRSKNQQSANRVTLRMNISPEDTVESHYAAATKFINQATFGLVDDSGRINYYINPGIDISSQVKIKCSTMTGINTDKPKKGLSPEERFAKDSTRTRSDSDTPYAEWTLKQEAVDVIRKSFINITPIMDNIKKGDLETAERLIGHLDPKNKTQVLNKIQDLKTNNIDADNIVLTDYKNAVDFINSLKWQKKKQKTTTKYFLVGTNTKAQEETIKELRKLIKQWSSVESLDWYRHFSKRLSKLIGKIK